jgi:hypothetical protein
LEGAVIAANQAAIDAAVQRYQIGSDQPLPATADQHEAWKRVATLAKSLAKVEDAVAVLGSDPFNPTDPGWLQRVAADLAKLQQIARTRAEDYRPKTRDELLIIEVLRIWEGAGQRLGTSLGPSARFLNKVLPWHPEIETARRYIRDEKKRRQLIPQVMAGGGNSFVDPDKVLLVDKDGNIVQGR